MIIHAHSVSSASASSSLLHPWFAVLVIAGAIEKLSGVALGVAMERDWVVLVVPHSMHFGCFLHREHWSSISRKVDCELNYSSCVCS